MQLNKGKDAKKKEKQQKRPGEINEWDYFVTVGGSNIIRQLKSEHDDSARACYYWLQAGSWICI